MYVISGTSQENGIQYETKYQGAIVLNSIPTNDVVDFACSKATNKRMQKEGEVYTRWHFDYLISIFVGECWLAISR